MFSKIAQRHTVGQEPPCRAVKVELRTNHAQIRWSRLSQLMIPVCLADCSIHSCLYPLVSPESDPLILPPNRCSLN